jgi:hypothetical protein
MEVDIKFKLKLEISWNLKLTRFYYTTYGKGKQNSYMLHDTGIGN